MPTNQLSLMNFLGTLFGQRVSFSEHYTPTVAAAHLHVATSSIRIRLQFIISVTRMLDFAHEGVLQRQ